MKQFTTRRRRTTIQHLRLAHEQEVVDPIDELVYEASLGDDRAVTLVAEVFKYVMVRAARRELGPKREHEAADAVDRLLLALLRHELVFPLAKGAAVPWVRKAVRGYARAIRHKPGVSMGAPCDLSDPGAQ
jgi:hypothetical protein